jgi:hypothetical protein
LNDPYAKKLNYFARHTVPELFCLPDIEYFTWVLPLRKKIKSLVKIDDFDFIYTNSLPQSVHLLGAILKREFGIPWVAHFYEPSTGNNFRNLKINWIKKLHEKQERTVAEHADIIIHNNDIIQQFWMDKYGPEIAKKIEVLPLCTDSRIVATTKKHRQNKKLTIVHAGGIYGNRNLKELIKAVTFLKERITDLDKILEIQILGILSPIDKSNIINNKLDRIFNILGKLDYVITQDYLQNADALLVVDALDTKDYVFFPSKLCEYFSYKKPIIGITPQNSVSRELLSESGHSVFDADEYRELAHLLEDLIYNKRNLIFDENYFKNFLPDHLGYLFKGMLNRVLTTNKKTINP